MLKKLDNFFFDADSTVFDRLRFYGTIAFLVIISMMALVVVKL